MVKKHTATPPRLDVLRLVDLTPGDAAGLAAHEQYDGLRFEGVDLDHRGLAGLSCSECEFSNVSAHETDLRASVFADVAFDRLNAPIFSAPRSQFRDVGIDQSRLGSAELYESTWQSVHIRHSKLGYVNLRGATLQDVLFTDCTIDELDLGGASANRIAFVDTQVNGLDLTRATLANADLRGLELRKLSGLEGLRGATLTEYQIAELAPLFAAQIGIVVA